MKLIIDIPEELYTYMQSESYDAHLDKRFDYRIRFAVRDAIPLPKGHGRLIDADAVSLSDIGFFSIRDYNKMVHKLTTTEPTIIEADTESEG